MRQVAGVACITVAPDDESNSESRATSRVASRLAITRRAQTVIGKQSSNTAKSKDKVVTDTRTSLSVRPGSRRIAVQNYTTARRQIPTHFARLVEPAA